MEGFRKSGHIYVYSYVHENSAIITKPSDPSIVYTTCMLSFGLLASIKISIIDNQFVFIGSHVAIQVNPTFLVLKMSH